MLKDTKVIAAVRNEDELKSAISSKAELIFDLSPNIISLKERAESVHESGKKLCIHLDLAEGIGKDRYGIEYARTKGIDGIISTRVNIIKAAREAGLFTVQRFFIVDSHSLVTTVDAIKSSKPDMIEIMPGIIPKVIKDLRQNLTMPIIAGGLIDDISEVELAVKCGAAAVSTGKQQLWNM